MASWRGGLGLVGLLVLSCAGGDTTDRVTEDSVPGGGAAGEGSGGSSNQSGSTGGAGEGAGGGAGSLPGGNGGAPGGSGAVLCVPGQQLECACPGGQSKGAQACKEDGSGFGACEGCSSGPGGAGGTSSGGADPGTGGTSNPFGGGSQNTGGSGVGGSASGGSNASGGSGAFGGSNASGGSSASGGSASGGSSSGCSVQGCSTVVGSMAGCEGATVIGRLDALAGYATSGTTCGAGNSSDLSTCYDIGNDRSYRIYLRKGDTLSLSVTSKESCSGGAGWQMSLKLFISESCEAASCTSASFDLDCKAPYTKASPTYKATKDAWVTFIVDGFTAEAGGAYDLSAKLVCSGGCGC